MAEIRIRPLNIGHGDNSIVERRAYMRYTVNDLSLRFFTSTAFTTRFTRIASASRTGTGFFCFFNRNNSALGHGHLDKDW